MARVNMKFKPIIEDLSELDNVEMEARHTLWRQGDLSWKLDECQNIIYDAITNQDEIVTTVLASRRTGKSFVSLITEIELCIQQPLIICKHACPTQKMVKEMIYPQLRIIFQDAPPEFKLDDLWNATEGKLKFPNGSMITIAGTDGNNADNLRGTYMHFGVCDEAAFMENLSYVVGQILRPQALTTGGKISLISTPNPRELEHEFHTKFVFPAEAAGKLVKMTIHDNKRLTPEQIQREIDSYPLKEKDPAFLAEYMVQIPKVSEASVFPEFSLYKEVIIDDTLKLPEFCDTYVAGDVGVRDLTIYIFAYYDFKNACLCVLDEYVSNGTEQTTEGIANAIRLKESSAFVNEHGKFYPPTKRVMDNALQMINDFNRIHGLKISATKKDNKFAAVNDLRDLLSSERIKIHPRCKHLIYHMEHAKWKDKKGIKAEFDHLNDSPNGDIKGGHVDACFVPGTRILTKNGYINIEEVSPGTEVLTHKGRFRKVNHIMSKEYDGEVYKTKVKTKNKTIVGTIDHRFFVTEFYRNKNNEARYPINNKFEALSDNMSNKRLYEPFIPVNDEINLSKEMCFLYGYFVAEGALGGNKSQVKFAGSQNETNVENIIKKAVHEHYPDPKGISKESIRRHKLGLNNPRKCDTSFISEKTNKGRSIYIGKRQLWEDLRPLGKSDQKRFPDFIGKLNHEQSLYMLSGYLYGDGCFSRIVKWSTISSEISEGVEILLKKLKYSPSTNLGRSPTIAKFPNGSYQTKQTYEGYLPNGQSHRLLDEILSEPDLFYVFEQKSQKLATKTREESSYIEYKTVDKIEKQWYTGKVFNLEVEEDESYCVEGIAVHNCDALLYMTRNIKFGNNPRPEKSIIVTENQHYGNPIEETPRTNFMKKIFGHKGKK